MFFEHKTSNLFAPHPTTTLYLETAPISQAEVFQKTN